MKINVQYDIYEYPTCVVVNDITRHGHSHREIQQIDYWPAPGHDLSYDVEVDVCDICNEEVEF